MKGFATGILPIAILAAACAQIQGPAPGIDALTDTSIDMPGDPSADSPFDPPADGTDAPAEGGDLPWDTLGDCGPGLAYCTGACVNLLADPSSCSWCGHECPAGLNAVPVCEMGVCGSNCAPGWADPDGDGDCDSTCIPTSPTESCNGLDDDCDGVRDDGFPCRMGQPLGCLTECDTMGSGICGADCQLPLPSNCTPPTEVCNGADDDCDGDCDDGLGCCGGAREPCASTCSTTGMRSCGSSCSWGACEPPLEVCNGTDDDCDGSVDEDYVTYQCPLSGAVNADRATCDAGCSTTQACVAYAAASGTIVFRDCDYEGSCYPSYRVDKVEASGATISFSSSAGWYGSYTLVGSLAIAGATASGTIVFRDCDYEGSFYPNYNVDKIEASGATIGFYASAGWYGSYNLVGSITLAGATASGTVIFRDCDYEGSCYPSYSMDKIEASGTNISFSSSAGWYGMYNLVGSITITPGVDVCPLDSSIACTGSPSTCTQAVACEAITDC